MTTSREAVSQLFIPAIGGDLTEEEKCFAVDLPLELQIILKIQPGQLIQVSGRYDAAKSTFLFDIAADNHRNHKIIHIISDELTKNQIKERMDLLGIPRPHANLKQYRMEPGWEDLITNEPWIFLVDYVEATFKVTSKKNRPTKTDQNQKNSR